MHLEFKVTIETKEGDEDCRRRQLSSNYYRDAKLALGKIFVCRFLINSLAICSKLPVFNFQSCISFLQQAYW